MDKKQNNNSFKYVWSAVMVIVYLGLAYLFAFTQLFANIDFKIRIAMAVLCTVYGIFRGYRLLKMNNDKPE